MSRKRKSKSSASGGAVWRAISWHKMKRPMGFAVCAVAAAAVALAGSRAIAHFNQRLDQSLLEENPTASVEFVGLPEGLMALAGGDLRGSNADLLERPWTEPDLCRLMALRLSTIGWIESIEAVDRTRTGR